MPSALSGIDWASPSRSIPRSCACCGVDGAMMVLLTYCVRTSGGPSGPAASGAPAASAPPSSSPPHPPSMTITRSSLFMTGESTSGSELLQPLLHALHVALALGTRRFVDLPRRLPHLVRPRAISAAVVDRARQPEGAAPELDGVVGLVLVQRV